MDKNKIELVESVPVSTERRLYDGVESGLENRQFSVQVSKKNIVTFDASEFTTYKGKDFKELSETIDIGIFESMVRESGFNIRKPASLGYYKTEEHLAIEYFIKDGHIFAFTFGEKQPSRWILILEGIWKIV